MKASVKTRLLLSNPNKKMSNDFVRRIVIAKFFLRFVDR